MFVGETGVGRVVERTAQLMKEGNDDVRKAGGVDLPLIQKYLNLWFTLSLDLFGGEVSSNAADFFASGLKGRQKEDRLDEHTALDQYYNLNVFRDGKRTMEEVPLRNALNEVLRDSYVDDCQRGVDRWNKTLEEHGINFELKLPHRSFHRHIGEFANVHFDPEGNFLSDEEWDKRKDEFLPSEEDKVFVKSLMHAVREPGKIANWIAPPKRGINGQPFEFEYVRLS